MAKPTLNQESSYNANYHPTPWLFSTAAYVGLPGKGEPTPEGTCGQVSLLANSRVHQDSSSVH